MGVPAYTPNMPASVTVIFRKRLRGTSGANSVATRAYGSIRGSGAAAIAAPAFWVVFRPNSDANRRSQGLGLGPLDKCKRTSASISSRLHRARLLQTPTRASHRVLLRLASVLPALIWGLVHSKGYNHLSHSICHREK